MTKYCFLILGDDTSFFFIISFSFGFLLCYVIINFYENYFIINFFFSLKLFLFFHVPGYSGMFRNVPAFIDAQNQFPTSETLGELGGGGGGGEAFFSAGETRTKTRVCTPQATGMGTGNIRIKIG